LARGKLSLQFRDPAVENTDILVVHLDDLRRDKILALHCLLCLGDIQKKDRDPKKRDGEHHDTVPCVPWWLRRLHDGNDLASLDLFLHGGSLHIRMVTLLLFNICHAKVYIRPLDLAATMNNIFVDKYGGSSLASPEHDLQVVQNIERAVRRGERLVVFCSAKGSAQPGKPKVTRRLHALCTSILEDGIDKQEARRRAIGIVEEHVNDAAQFNEDLLRDIAADLIIACDVLIETRDAGMSPSDARTLTLVDRIEGIGERFKVRKIAALGQVRGLDTVAYDAWDVGFITDDHFRNATVPCSQYGAIKVSLERILTKGRIPVVTGFIGKTGDGRHTTGGYNSSDLWATIAGAALGAQEVRIYNAEIDALCSINPSIAAAISITPRALDHISYEEADELALQGAKLHPSSIKPARKHGVPVRVLNAFDERDPHTRGTLIGLDSRVSGPRAFTSKEVKLVNVHLSEMDSAYGYAAKVYNVLADLGINAEMGDAASNTAVRIAFDADANTRDITSGLEKQGIRNGHVTFTEDTMQIYCVGAGIRNDLNGIICRIHIALDNANIKPVMVGHGASESTYGLIVSKKDAHHALVALHEEFYGNSTQAGPDAS